MCSLSCRWSSLVHSERDLPEEFIFKTFCDRIRHELTEQLRRQWRIKMSGVGVAATYVTVPG
jgi:hypothetical protein